MGELNIEYKKDMNNMIKNINSFKKRYYYNKFGKRLFYYILKNELKKSKEKLKRIILTKL